MNILALHKLRFYHSMTIDLKKCLHSEINNEIYFRILKQLPDI